MSEGVIGDVRRSERDVRESVRDARISRVANRLYQKR